VVAAESVTIEVGSVLDGFELHAVIAAVNTIVNAKITFFIFLFIWVY
jgi:hypothetical protein